MGLMVTLARLVIVPSADCVVRVAWVASQMYDTDKPADQWALKLYVKPALTIGANELLSRAVVGPSSALPYVGEFRN